MANEKKPNNFKISPWLIYVLVIAGFIALNYFGGSGFQDTTKISYSKFNEYLNKGKIEKVIIYNKTEGEAYLTKSALEEKENKKVASDMMGNVNKGPHYSFDIGNDEDFQNKIEKASDEGKIKSFEFKAVQFLKRFWMHKHHSASPLDPTHLVWGVAGAGFRMYCY